jgi:DNA (cytosine-5)-methyltransferase 1
MLETYHPGLPYVIENVSGARGELPDPVVMCMWMFGRHTYRHRLLWPGGGLVLTPPAPPPPFHLQQRFNSECGWPHPVPTARAGHWEPGKFVSVAGHERKQPVLDVMEIDWMSSRDRIKEAIPPYLGRWVADQLAAWRAGQEMAA